MCSERERVCPFTGIAGKRAKNLLNGNEPRLSKLRSGWFPNSGSEQNALTRVVALVKIILRRVNERKIKCLSPLLRQHCRLSVGVNGNDSQSGAYSSLMKSDAHLAARQTSSKYLFRAGLQIQSFLVLVANANKRMPGLHSNCAITERQTWNAAPERARFQLSAYGSSRTAPVQHSLPCPRA